MPRLTSLCPRRVLPWLPAVLLLLVANVQAAERRFMPVAASDLQRIDVVGTTPVVSQRARGFSGGASILPVSARKARVLVSVRNLGAAPIGFGAKHLTITAGEDVLAVEAVESMDRAAGSLPGGSNCLNVSQSSYSACLELDSRRAATGAVASERAPSAAAEVAVDPQQTQARQFLIALPRKSKGEPLALKVRIESGGETLAFDFREVE